MSLDQRKELHPMTPLQRFFVKLLGEINDHRSLFHLLLNLSSQWLALVVDKLVCRELNLKVGHDLVY